MGNDLLSGSYGTITEVLSAYSISTGFPHLLSKLTALEHLHIENTNIGNVAEGMLNLATPEAMRRMTISYCPLYNFEAPAFPAGFKSNLRLPQQPDRPERSRVPADPRRRIETGIRQQWRAMRLCPVLAGARSPPPVGPSLGQMSQRQRRPGRPQ